MPAASVKVITGSMLPRSEEHTSELQSLRHLVCRLLLEKKKQIGAEESCRLGSRVFFRSEHHVVVGPDIHDCADNGRFFFFFNDTATTETYTLSLHDALPISCARSARPTRPASPTTSGPSAPGPMARSEEHTSELQSLRHLVCRLLLEKK